MHDHLCARSGAPPRSHHRQLLPHGGAADLQRPHLHPAVPDADCRSATAAADTGQLPAVAYTDQHPAVANAVRNPAAAHTNQRPATTVADAGEHPAAWGNVPAPAAEQWDGCVCSAAGALYKWRWPPADHGAGPQFNIPIH